MAGLVLALAVIAFGAWYRSSWDQRRIENNLASMLKLVCKEQAESVIVSVSKIRKAAAHLDDRVSIDFGGALPALESRNSCIAFLQQVRTQATSLSVKTYDRKTILATDKRRATMTLTMGAVVKYAGETRKEFREVRIEWAKKEHDWLIREAAVVQTIQPPPFSTVE